MSRAFVKEDGPEDTRLPDLPLSPHPNVVTARGLAQLQSRLAARQADLATLRGTPDTQGRAAAERDIRYLEARLRSAILAPADSAPARVAFGTCVTLTDAQGATATWTIVGEDEADPPRHMISPHTPLARALIGAEPGETVTWAGRSLTVTAIVPA